MLFVEELASLQNQGPGNRSVSGPIPLGLDKILESARLSLRHNLSSLPSVSSALRLIANPTGRRARLDKKPTALNLDAQINAAVLA
jgi:hypothetical protein